MNGLEMGFGYYFRAVPSVSVPTTVTMICQKSKWHYQEPLTQCHHFFRGALPDAKPSPGANKIIGVMIGNK